MKIIHSFKRKIGIMINKTPMRRTFEVFNLIIFHWADRLREKHPGKVERKTIIVRPQTNTQGLLSSYLYVLKYVRWAEQIGADAYVDFTGSKCQYYTGREIHGSKNAWDYYFQQPSHLTTEDCKQSKTLIYSGWSLSKKKQPIPIPKRPEVAEDKEIVRIAQKVCPINQYVIDLVEKKHRELFTGEVLGVFLRGTDYVKLKPKGHAKQPSIEEVTRKIDEYLQKYQSIKSIFVVTEDSNYFQILKNRYGEKVFSSDNYFVKKCDKKQYVESAFTNDAYERGLNYLVRILLFGKCEYTIAGITNGSVVANILRTQKAKDSYWFDLGMY